MHDTVVPRVSRVGYLSLLLTLALLIFAAVAALVGMPTKSAAAPALPHARPAATIRPAVPALPAHQVGDRVLQHFDDTGLLAVTVDRSDPALLHVVVARGTRPLDCNVIRPEARVIAQDASAVRIVVSGYEYVPMSTARSGLGGTTCVTSGSAAVPVRLTSGLGARRVYDGRSSAATTVADPAVSGP